MIRKVSKVRGVGRLALVAAVAGFLGGCIDDNPGFGGKRDDAGGDANPDVRLDRGGLDGGAPDGGSTDSTAEDASNPDQALPRDQALGDLALGDLALGDSGPFDGEPLDEGSAGDEGVRPDASDPFDLGTADAGPDLGPLDEDEDGVFTPLDCDDDDPLRYPGAPERCNGADDDCDGASDEDIAGLGADCSAGTGRCEVRGIGVCDADGVGVVCDARPGAPTPETCNDDDDDCDGLVDESVPGCICEPSGELCNRVDDDCDGAVDEGVLNACGACGPVPGEQCNGQDDDCDGRTDEGALNACGACGPVPGEQCNGQDDDCDGRTDEGAVNACGRCGPVPGEQCNGQDDDCDGRTDEGVLNACGQCGAVPVEACNGRDDDCDGAADENADQACQSQCGAGVQRCVNGQLRDCEGPASADEVCNGADDDCDGRTDEDIRIACQTACGEGAIRCDGGQLTVCSARQPVPEVCDFQDNDCDGQVDEGLQVPCAVNVGRYQGGNGNLAFGRQVLAIDDRTGDGVPEVVVSGVSANGSDQVALVNGATGQAVWTQTGPGEFGAALAYAALTPNGPKRIIVGAPTAANQGNTTGAIYLLNVETGAEATRIASSGTGRFGQALATYVVDGREVLAVGEPLRATAGGGGGGGQRNAGRVIVFNYNALGAFNVVFEIYGELANLQLGERLYVGTDVTGDGVPELVMTQNTFNNSQLIRAVNGTTGAAVATLAPNGANFDTYGDAFALGRLQGNGGLGYAVGVPDATAGNVEGAGVVLVYSPFGAVIAQFSSAVERARQGSALVNWSRPDRPADLLLVGSRALGRVDIFDPATGGLLPAIPAGGSFGATMALSAPLADGTRRLFLGGPDENGGRGAVVIYSLR